MNASLPKARPVLLALTTVLVLLISLFSAPSAARADTLSIPGTLSASSPTFTHLNPPGCTTGSVATHYRAIKARTTGTSPTQFTAKVTPNGFTANLTVYQGVFLPDMPIVNCFSSATGSGPGVPVEYSFPIPAILPGFTYQDFFIVVAGSSASDLGSFTVEVTSSNHTLDLELEPEPSTDTTPPVVTVPGNVTREATGPGGAPVTYSGATATDDVDGSLTPLCSPASGATFPLGATTVTCSATDSAGNTGSNSFTVTVQDTTAPALSLPSSITEEATGSGGATVNFSASATDTVDGAITPVCTVGPDTVASGDIFPLGTTTVSCTATDSEGNIGTGSFDITVEDTTAPVLDLPSSVSQEASDADGAVVTYTATAEDLVDGALTPVCTPASGSLFPITTPLTVNTVTCTATDAAGNTSAPDSFVVSVLDTTAPVLDLPDTVIEKIIGAAPVAESSLGAVTAAFSAAAPAGAEVSFTASATNLVDGAITPVCAPASGTMFAVGDTTVTCTATGTAGNTATGSFTVSVIVVDPKTPGPGENGTSGPGKNSPSEPGLSRTGSAPHGLLAASALLLALGALVVARSRRASQRAR
ncbi:HYR domain-containing protein [Leucobacter celer]|uniref:HYR domain-containing protein n=1 Tax=Leucobacter celer TaxID=668625 RepID=UPI000A670731|nr:HYR domain-containing protein [Leucobacter celer]